LTLDPIVLGGLGLAFMFVLIALHIPIGIAMGLSGLVLVALQIGWSPALSLLSTVPSSIFASADLAVIPLFLLMGSFAAAAGLSADIYRLAHALIGHHPGGLVLATIGGCAGFGAVCGSSVATAATFARIALPEMLKRKYEPGLAAGSIAAGGTLGILIPPSVIMVMYAVLTEQFVLALFVAAIVPGLIAVLLHFIAVAIYVRIHPDAAPAATRLSWRDRLAIVRQCWAVIVLAAAVSGGLYTGVFTVSEAAAVGAGLAFLFTILRGRLTRAVFMEVLGETAANTGLIYVIMIGASIFTYFVTLSHMPQASIELIQSWELSPLMIMLLLSILYIILGGIFDEVAAMVITLPFVFPLVISAGFDPVWFGIYNVMIIEIGMIAPPIGVNVFVLHGMARTIPLTTIYRGIVPFLMADVVRLALLVFFPALALWLPQTLGMPM
jgi:tripartite ATP-independent transporter DctM subunit